MYKKVVCHIIHASLHYDSGLCNSTVESPKLCSGGGRAQLSKQTIWQWWAAVAIPWYTLVVTGSNTVVRDHFQPVHSHIFSITRSTCEGVRGEV